MQDYDIHLFNETGKLSLSMRGNYASDFAAIRAAEYLCKEHEKVEVWSGEGCIFASAPRGDSGSHLTAA
ncbi:MAG TPA: hypothetical protein VNW15_16010 [Rhizomicrobium sp.]|jgi:hypothetical protein|nr:hypothetical protein [Rhizomicrobium sp.]